MNEEEFLELRPEFSNVDPHDLMIARLRHEEQERERLEAYKRELSAKKAALIVENKQRKADLEALEEQLRTFIQVYLLSVTNLTITEC